MPGTIIRERSTRVARGLPTDTGTFFLAGPADRGPVDKPLLIQSLSEFVTRFGPRVSYSSAYDMVEAYFAGGGTRMYFSRIVGPAPVTATVNLLDSGAGVSLVANAISPGEWGNALNVQVLAGDAAGEFKIQVTHDTDTGVSETSPSLVDQAAAIAWAANSDYIRLVLGATALDPAPGAAVSLAGGADDRANISDATSLTALNLFNKDLGPGQVAYANRTTATAHGHLADHAKANNRVALYDPPDTTSKATLLTTASAVRGLSNGKYGALFAPWLTIGALAGGGSARSIPPSALVAAAIARNDGSGLSPNKPAAGDLGILDFAQSVKATFSKTDSDDLNAAAVNVILEKAGDIRIYGWRSGTSKDSNPNWWQFGNVRLYMTIAALADNILERFVLKEIDGKGLIFGRLKGQLLAMLESFYPESLHASTPEEAFAVDTGPSVNTPTTIANAEIHAVIELTMSPMGETVILDIYKAQIAA